MANSTADNKQEIIPQAIEFQPDALEIKNERLPWWIRHSAVYALLFVIAAIVWASVSKIDVVIQAPAKVVTNESNIVMKPLERAVIQKIHVRIGQIVEKDQVLITFDPTLNKADAERLAKELEVLNAQVERLKAESAGLDRYMPSVNNESTRRQQKIFAQKAQYFKYRCDAFDENVKELQAAVKAREDTLENQKTRLLKVKHIEDTYKWLKERNVVAELKVFSVEITRLEMEASIAEQENQILKLKHEINNAKASKQSFIHDWQKSISEELVQAERELSATQKTYAKAKQLVEYVELRAPCESVVHEIAAFPVGSAVQEAEALITLIPLSGIELEAEIPPHYISKVHSGSEARIKLNAYPFQKYGTLDGVVRNISENTLQKNIGQQSMTYYRGRLTVSGKLKNAEESFRLIPGMEALAEIKTGNRTVIEYVIYPLIKALDESIREP